MNRRRFLSLLSAAPAALILPELLLPKTFFLPPAGGWVQPSLAKLWYDYALKSVPVGVAVQSYVDCPSTEIWELNGVAQLRLGTDIDAATERLMRAALTKEPDYSRPATLWSLVPWVNA
jgi:hypothetical protein